MGILSLFTKTKEVDYDTYLSLLQDKIAARQQKLQQIRLRERRANALFITYGIALYVLYIALWYFGVVGKRYGHHSTFEKAVGILPMIVFPVVIIFTRRAVRWVYRRREAKEEMIIKSLLKKKQDKVEEIKKKTGYYSTRDLLEKYDEGLKKNSDPRSSLPGTPIKQIGKQGSLPSSASTPARLASASGPSTPQAQVAGHARSATTGSVAPSPAGSVPFPSSSPEVHAPSPRPQQAGGPPVNSLPQSRSVMDKLADALLGVSPEEANPQNHKYALICQRCYAHNGLVPKDDFDFVQYRCPHCGHFNPRRRDPLLPSGSSASSASSESVHPHRRVQSMHAPSPLQRSYPLFDSPASPEMQERTRAGDEHSDDQEEEVEAAKEVVLDEGKSGSSARSQRSDQEPRRRRAGAAVHREEDEDDKMDTEE
ncbi:uncharacterized protein JCM15063_003819 [Sporobolomyces koalae]|uniref:uncharacterized protein n=1 Tax=Sporobolomyces koalae TaxID=500713 RepID=UPI0031785D6D